MHTTHLFTHVPHHPCYPPPLLPTTPVTQQGRVCIGGHDVRDLTLTSLRAAVGQVPQEPVLFNDTIFYNIMYGNLNASDEEVYDAARQVGCEGGRVGS